MSLQYYIGCKMHLAIFVKILEGDIRAAANASTKKYD